MNSARISKHYKKANKNVKNFQMSLENHLSNSKKDSKNRFSSNAYNNVQLNANNQPSDSSIEDVSNPSNNNIRDFFSTDDIELGGTSNDYNQSSSCSSSANFNTESDFLVTESCQDTDETVTSIQEANSSIIDHNMDFTNNSCGPSLISQLSEWALNYNITHVAINELLKILKPKHPELPSDARTLMHTPRSIILKDVEPGKYYHFGLEYCVKNLLQNLLLKQKKPSIETSIIESKLIEILINIDGLPISTSSSSQFYPILCSIYDTDDVGVIGIFHGNEKPKDSNTFLNDFVHEAIQLITNNFVYEGFHYSIKIKGFICDTPAKSFIKYIKGHSGYASCTKCHTEGTFLNNSVSFPQVKNLKLRLDSDFRNRLQEDHHTGNSIIENIPGVDMIKSFPLDYMHLVCLGITKKLISFWVNGKPSLKLSFRQVCNLSDLLLEQKPHIPNEFNRKPRTIHEFKRWKATEFRQFLLYTGPVILKSVLPLDKYINFLSLHIAITILSCAGHFSKLEYAERLLQYFVETFISLYGKEYVSHNVHSLLHLTTDVKEFGPLDKFSAFKFENFMQTLKKGIRKQEKPLQQLINRTQEQNVANKNKISSICWPAYLNNYFNGPILNYQQPFQQFKEIKFKTFTLKIFEPDNCCSLKNGSVVCLENIIQTNTESVIIGKEYLTKTNFYTEPCESSELGIYVVSQLGLLKSWNINDIASKCLKLSFNEKCIVFPLLHTA